MFELVLLRVLDFGISFTTLSQKTDTNINSKNFGLECNIVHDGKRAYIIMAPPK